MKKDDVENQDGDWWLEEDAFNVNSDKKNPFE
jgi:hypothetical protein